MGPLASDDPRFKEKIYMRTPSPTRYDTGVTWGTREKAKVPFGSITQRLVSFGDKLPGLV